MAAPTHEPTNLATDPVCAVIVTFHPDADVIANLQALRPQVSRVVVVDNGSTPEELAQLRQAALALDVELIENGDNLGIAAALNRGIRRALELDYLWVLLFDQDSRVTEDFTQTMMGAFAASPSRDRLAILIPRYEDRRFGHILEPLGGSGTVLKAATTSGSLMPARIFQHAGLFAEELFIDAVDYEYSLRVRALGYLIAECTTATLLHSPGTPTSHSLLGLKSFHSANYSPIRRYYQERNKIWVARRYFATFPRFCLRLFSFTITDAIKVVLVEQDKRAKLSAFLRGVIDGCMNRMGKYSGN